MKMFESALASRLPLLYAWLHGVAIAVLWPSCHIGCWNVYARACPHVCRWHCKDEPLLRNQLSQLNFSQPAHLLSHNVGKQVTLPASAMCRTSLAPSVRSPTSAKTFLGWASAKAYSPVCQHLCRPFVGRSQSVSIHLRCRKKKQAVALAAMAVGARAALVLVALLGTVCSAKAARLLISYPNRLRVGLFLAIRVEPFLIGVAFVACSRSSLCAPAWLLAVASAEVLSEAGSCS